MGIGQTVQHTTYETGTTNNANDPPKETRFNRGLWLAWTLCAIVIVFTLLGLVIGLRARGPQENALALATGVMDGVSKIVFGIVGALILGRYARHTIGWLLMVIALSLAVIGLLQSYLGQTATASPGPTFTTMLLFWLSGWTWWLLIGPLLLILLLFPTGRLLSPRWRWVIVTMTILFAIFLFFATFSKTLTDTSSDRTLPNPIGVIPEGLSFEVISIPWAIMLFAAATACVVSVFVRYRRATSAEREQIKWFLYACTVFLFVYAGGFLNTGTSGVFDVLLSTAILLIPVSIGIAILRHRLWDIDLIIRRTVVYVPLTAILAGIFAASITLTQKFFVGATGQQSDAATVLTTLIVVAAFEPIKSRLQNVVDARFKEAPDPVRHLRVFRDEVLKEMGVIDARRMTRRLLGEAMDAFDATGGAVFLSNSDSAKPSHTRGIWMGDATLRVALGSNGAQLGEIALGARKNGLDYSEQDRAALAETARIVAEAIQDNEAHGE